MAITGHATSSMFKRYAITSEAQKAQALAQVEQFVTSSAQDRKVIAMKAGT
jgi:hypothetical protein